MLGRIRRMLKNQKGFTLVELMTVLIILGVILGIGVPKYLQVQAKAEWEADESTIKNFARAAETYAASMNDYSEVSLKTLADADIIDKTIVLNRTTTGKNNGTALTQDKMTNTKFTFDPKTGNVDNLGTVVKGLIGSPPYGDEPDYFPTT